MMGKTQKSENLLAQVQKGMAVFDVHKQRVGTITDVYFGDTATEASRAKANETTISHDLGTLPGTDTTQPPSIPAAPPANNEALSSSFRFENGLPDSIRARSLTQGFIRVRGAGLMPPGCYITPDQLASLKVRDVYLSVTRDQLIEAKNGLSG